MYLRKVWMPFVHDKCDLVLQDSKLEPFAKVATMCIHVSIFMNIISQVFSSLVMYLPIS